VIGTSGYPMLYLHPHLGQREKLCPRKDKNVCCQLPWSPAETRCTHRTYEDDGICAKRLIHHSHKQQYLYDLHRLGVRRLYCGPSRRMMRPRMMKLAATSGVGAMMRHTALYHFTLAKGKRRGRRDLTHCMIYGLSR
jgi:hypothetical protein